MRVLVVDGHTGPAKDAAAFLSQYMNYKVEVIQFYMYTKHSTRYEKLIPDRMRHKIQAQLSHCNSNDNFKTCLPGNELELKYLNHYVDVVLCQFPGFQCSLFDKMKIKLWIRFTHRYTHHIFRGGEHTKQKWDRTIIRWNAEKKALFFADNPYDYEYAKYFLNISITKWYSSVLYLSTHDYVSHTRNQLCWCCQKQLSRSAFLVARQIQRTIASRILTISDAIVQHEAPSLLQMTNCTHLILIPHSLHSYTSVEAYALNYQIAVPSAKLLATWHFKYHLVQHKNPGNVPSMWPPYDNFPPCSNKLYDLTRWFAFCDFLNWKHVRIFESVNNITFNSPRKLQHLELQAQIQKTKKYLDNFSKKRFWKKN